MDPPLPEPLSRGFAFIRSYVRENFRKARPHLSDQCVIA
ncbi:hypothetical protein ACIPSK_26355 [Rhizobium sp. LARHSG275]